jgi:hypothetical protein
MSAEWIAVRISVNPVAQPSAKQPIESVFGVFFQGYLGVADRPQRAAQNPH